MQVIEHNGVFALATWTGTNWIASMTPSARRLTGCTQVSARAELGIISSPNVRTYRTEAGARRALRAIIVEREPLRPLRALANAGLRVDKAALAAEDENSRRIDREVNASFDREQAAREATY